METIIKWSVWGGFPLFTPGSAADDSPPRGRGGGEEGALGREKGRKDGGVPSLLVFTIRKRRL